MPAGKAQLACCLSHEVCKLDPTRTRGMLWCLLCWQNGLPHTWCNSKDQQCHQTAPGHTMCSLFVQHCLDIVQLRNFCTEVVLLRPGIFPAQFSHIAPSVTGSNTPFLPAGHCSHEPFEASVPMLHVTRVSPLHMNPSVQLRHSCSGAGHMRRKSTLVVSCVSGSGICSLFGALSLNNRLPSASNMYSPGLVAKDDVINFWHTGVGAGVCAGAGLGGFTY